MLFGRRSPCYDEKNVTLRNGRGEHGTGKNGGGPVCAEPQRADAPGQRILRADRLAFRPFMRRARRAAPGGSGPGALSALVRRPVGG